MYRLSLFGRSGLAGAYRPNGLISNNNRRERINANDIQYRLQLAADNGFCLVSFALGERLADAKHRHYTSSQRSLNLPGDNTVAFSEELTTLRSR